MIRISMPLFTQLVIIIASFLAGALAAWLGGRNR